MREIAAPLVFDTQSIAKPERFEFWNNFIARRVLRVAMESRLHEDYKGHIEAHDLGNATIIFLRGDSCSSARGRREINATRGDMPDWLLLRTNVACRITHNGHDEILQAGDLILIDARRPYIREDSILDVTILALSNATVKDWLCNLETHAGKRFSADHGWPRLISAIMAALDPELISTIGENPVSRQELSNHLISLVIHMVSRKSLEVAITSSEYGRSECARKHLYDLMLLWMRDHHIDPEVNAKKMAGVFGISIRYIHKLFASYSENSSFLKRLQNMRLERVIERFNNQNDTHLTISEISWCSGFADFGSFSRLFKKRYGMPPSAYRNLCKAKFPEIGRMRNGQ